MNSEKRIAPTDQNAADENHSGLTKAGVSKRKDMPTSPAGWRLSRHETKNAKARFRMTGDIAALERLLCHSIALGHGNLLVQRYALADALGVSLDRYKIYFEAAKDFIGDAEAAQAIRAARRKSDHIKGRMPILESTGDRS